MKSNFNEFQDNTGKMKPQEKWNQKLTGIELQ